MKTSFLFVVLLLASVVDHGLSKSKKSSRTKRAQVPCRQRIMVRYRMTVHLVWSRRTFPKQYPLVRPPAQWSPLVGASHSSGLSVWKAGSPASPGVKAFAETGDPGPLQAETAQADHRVLDAFTGPAVRQGQGQTSAVLFVDGNHTQVSFMMKLIPSPDWFIGLSGLELCRRGRWRRQAHVNLRPMDAGTDQGMTFSAPNWSSEPSENITAITSQSPSHDANSFYYPDFKVLPRIAYVDFELASEYRLRRTFLDLTSNQRTTPKPAIKKPTVASSKSDKVVSEPNTKDETLSKNGPLGDSVSKKKRGAFESSLSGAQFRSKSTKRPKPLPSQDEPSAEISPESLNEITFEELTPQEQEREEFHPEDCVVTAWSTWSQCSKTCGFGHKTRSREVIRFPGENGAPCPLLHKEVLCGSQRTCRRSHFNFLGSMGFSRLGQKDPTKGMKRRRRRPKPKV